MFSHATFAFCDSLIRKGYKAPLQPADLWDVPRKFETKPVYEEFEAKLKATEDSVKRPRVSSTDPIICILAFFADVNVISGMP